MIDLLRHKGADVCYHQTLRENSCHSWQENPIFATNDTNYHESKHFVKISEIRGKKKPISATNYTNYNETLREN